MSFNYMCVKSNLKNMDSFGAKLLGAAGSVLGSAGSMLKI